jgi:simple sugar transport system ATP-binding protein
VLIAASPTRGLDVGAIESVRRMLIDAADSGMGVLLISEDLEEVLALSDRILVMYEGGIVGEVPAAGADVATLGLLMGGDATAAPAAEAG